MMTHQAHSASATAAELNILAADKIAVRVNFSDPKGLCLGLKMPQTTGIPIPNGL